MHGRADRAPLPPRSAWGFHSYWFDIFVLNIVVQLLSLAVDGAWYLYLIVRSAPL